MLEIFVTISHPNCSSNHCMSSLQFLKNDLSEGSRKGYNFLEAAAAQPPVTTFENWGIEGGAKRTTARSLSVCLASSSPAPSCFIRGAPQEQLLVQVAEYPNIGVIFYLCNTAVGLNLLKRAEAE